MSPPRLSRRTVLRGGAVCVGLPLLDAMLPRAFAQSAVPSRFVAVYMGTCTGGAPLTNPSALGPFSAPLPLSFSALQAVAQHVSIISGLNFPIYASGGTPTAPGSAVQVQHGGTISPALSGVSAQDSVLPLIRGTTADQLAADFLGSGSKFHSLQLRVQAASYNNRTGTSAQQRGMSLRKTGATLSELLPNESPARLYSMLFSGAPPSPSPTPVLPTMLSKRKSVLDLVLDDANRLTNSVGGDDRARLDQHFTAIRELERGLTPPVSGTDGGVTMPPPPPPDGGVLPPNPGTCGAAPMNPGADPAISTYDFGGWANETQRGNSMADMIAYALACDLTRVASWMLTHDQCWLNSQHLSNSTVVTTSGISEVHNDSHFASADIKARNANWGAGLFGRLVGNLASRSEAGGTVLDRTFLSLVFAEGLNAHAKTNLTFAVAGTPSKIRNGQHIASGGAHPATVQTSGLQAIGMNVSTLGEVSGVVPGLRLP